VDKLHTALIEVVKTACECNADSSLYPKEWLFHYRWVNGKSKAVVPKDFYGNTIKFETVGSRTSAVVEAVVGRGELAGAAKAYAKKKRTTKSAASAATDTAVDSDSEQEEAATVKKARKPRAKKADNSSAAAAAAAAAADASSETHSSKAAKSTGNKRKRAVKAVQDNDDASDSVATESKLFSIAKKRGTTAISDDTIGASDEPQQLSKKKPAGKRTAKKSSGK
jgi:hypothetical protein